MRCTASIRQSSVTPSGAGQCVAPPAIAGAVFCPTGAVGGGCGLEDPQPLVIDSRDQVICTTTLVYSLLFFVTHTHCTLQWSRVQGFAPLLLEGDSGLIDVLTPTADFAGCTTTGCPERWSMFWTTVGSGRYYTLRFAGSLPPPRSLRLWLPYSNTSSVVMTVVYPVRWFDVLLGTYSVTRKHCSCAWPTTVKYHEYNDNRPSHAHYCSGLCVAVCMERALGVPAIPPGPAVDRPAHHRGRQPLRKLLLERVHVQSGRQARWTVVCGDP